MKPMSFLGSSLDDLRAFPETARREAGYQLDKVQRGLAPDDWKPLRSVESGVREIHIRDQAVASRREAVYLLHVFQKKTRATAKHDLELAEARLKELTLSKSCRRQGA